ncbi:MAG TPA: Ldh family oxidoreductase [Usitatibacter sp.]|nr:Ldh family oxidoreductase [Usitatibacter sp.]
MTEGELTALAARALQGSGVAEADARRAARILVLGDLFGHHTHGVSRLESYCERLAIGGIDARAAIRAESVAPGMIKVDGANGVGPAVGMHALEAALDAARSTGIAIAFARASNHFGACGPYCWIAAEQGFASIVGSNATPTIAPTGGLEERVGNNPLAIGVPRPGAEPIILDMAMSVAARAKIRNAAKRGEPIPDTWATDRLGNPTTDPGAALDGFLLPFGGYKGYGLALMVDLFAGVLSDASYLTRVNSWVDDPQLEQKIGHFFVVIDTKRLGNSEWLAARVADFAAIVHDTPRAAAGTPVRLPGEAEIANLVRQRRDGIDVDAALIAKLESYGARRG